MNNLEVVEEEAPNKELRPKLNKEIKFKTNKEDVWKQGKVCRVGKVNGKDKFKAWIKDNNGSETSHDFSKDISCWKYVPKNVTFVEANNNPTNKIAISEKRIYWSMVS